MISAATSSVFCLLFQYYIPENGVGVNCNEKSLGCVGGRGGWGGGVCGGFREKVGEEFCPTPSR